MRIFIYLIVAVISLASAGMAQEYRVALIPTDGLGGTPSAFNATLNDRCEATLTVTNETAAQGSAIRQVLLRRGVATELGRTVYDPGVVEHQGFGEITRTANNGVIVGNAFNDAGGQAAVRVRGLFQALPVPAGQSAFLVRGANNRGELVGAGFDDQLRITPYRYRNGGYESLAAFGFIDVLDIDLRGRIVGALRRPGSDESDWSILENGRLIPVNTASGLERDYIGRLSSAGVMVGGGFNRPYNDSLVVQKAVVWSTIDASPTVLFPGELDDSAFFDINDRGVAVGGARVSTPQRFEELAFIWTRSRGVQELNQLLSRPLRRLYKVSYPVAINNEGEIIASVARRNQFGGYNQATLAVLYPAANGYPCALR